MSHKKVLITILMILASVTVLAGTAMISKPDKAQIGFDTMDEAAKAAESVAMPESTDYEYGGGIYEKDGKFFYTIAVTTKDSRSVDYSVALYLGSHMVGVYHTHPDSSPFADQLSSSDLQTAKKMHMVMYVGVVKKNHVIKFDPASDVPVVARDGSMSFDPRVI